MLAGVIIAIALRGYGTRYKIWHVMAIGAMAMVFSGYLSPLRALAAINLDVVAFLFCLFVVGGALERSGYLSQIAIWIYGKARSVDKIVFLTIFGIGIISAIMMNDVIAIVGTPLMLYIAAKNRVSSKPLLFGLAFAVTIGGAMSPIGNPQNLLVAVNGDIADPFVTFARYLILPTMVNLLVAYLWLKFVFRKDFGKPAEINHAVLIKDAHLAKLCKISLILLLIMICLKIVLVTVELGGDFKLTYIALVTVAPILLFAKGRRGIVREIDWGTLIFFASLFIVMSAVWESGFIQSLIEMSEFDLLSIAVILVLSALLSQVMCNVPLVALYLPVMMGLGAGTREMMALVAGSTIAGNLLIIGAASNLIILQNAENRGDRSIGFVEFARVGAPLTVMNLAVYWAFLTFL
ncbi:MAG: SLC13 family permease [Thermoplasmata archaeon]